MNENQTINLLYCGNAAVTDGVMTSLLSIVKRSKPRPLHVFLFTMTLTRIKPSYIPITQEQAAFFERMLRSYVPESQVTLIDVTELYEKEFRGCPNESAYCSPYTLIRLLADEIPGLPDKFLYLDTDIFFNRDVSLLYDIDVSTVEYAAAPDHYGKYLIQPHYINAGVLLFNMEKARETGLFGKARDWLRKTKLTFADQSALIRSTTAKKVLPQRFNDQKFLHKHTIARHFSKRLFYFPYPHTANIKQYHIDQVHSVFHYHQFDDIYDEYLRWKTIYEEEKKHA
jgi:lipopolysaccharide biosynthesis glycosyltransferase